MLLNMVEQNVDASLKKKIYEKTEMSSILASIKKKLNLINIPSRIEIYDNSHLSGSNLSVEW